MQRAPFATSVEEVTDWYIPVDESQSILAYPGPIVPEGELLKRAHDIREAAAWTQSQDPSNPMDFQLLHEGIALRVHCQNTVHGHVFIMRKIAGTLPDLEKLNLPAEITRMLTLPDFAEGGGLVLVAGGPGHGKSTTAAAICLARVKKYGYFCLTVEDPPEFQMQGQYKSALGRIGQIVQVDVNSASYAHGLKDSLRCYPSNMRGSMLMVGEVRDGPAAAELLRAASNGQLVLATSHASDAIGALERLLSLARDEMGESEAKSLLAHSLRAVLHQTIVRGTLRMTVLLSGSATSSVASTIKSSSSLQQLGTELKRQQTLLAQGGSVLLDTVFNNLKTGKQQVTAKIRIMLVDDTKAMLLAAKSALGDRFEVATCEDGLAAVASIVAFKPDLVLVDILMPKLDGYETVAIIRMNEAFASTPVLMMSSKGGVFDIARGRLLGFDGNITKPFTPAEFKAAVAEHLPAHAFDEASTQ